MRIPLLSFLFCEQVEVISTRMLRTIFFLHWLLVVTWLFLKMKIWKQLITSWPNKQKKLNWGWIVTIFFSQKQNVRLSSNSLPCSLVSFFILTNIPCRCSEDLWEVCMHTVPTAQFDNVVHTFFESCRQCNVVVLLFFLQIKCGSELTIVLAFLVAIVFMSFAKDAFVYIVT